MRPITALKYLCQVASKFLSIQLGGLPRGNVEHDFLIYRIEDPAYPDWLILDLFRRFNRLHPSMDKRRLFECVEESRPRLSEGLRRRY